jgi:hypothetical protein
MPMTSQVHATEPIQVQYTAVMRREKEVLNSKNGEKQVKWEFKNGVKGNLPS